MRAGIFATQERGRYPNGNERRAHVRDAHRVGWLAGGSLVKLLINEIGGKL